MKRFSSLLILIALLVTGCVAPGGAPAPAEDAAADTAAEQSDSAATAGEPFRVAIVMPSSTEDVAWSQSMYAALIAVQTEMGGERNQFTRSSVVAAQGTLLVRTNETLFAIGE